MWLVATVLDNMQGPHSQKPGAQSESGRSQGPREPPPSARLQNRRAERTRVNHGTWHLGEAWGLAGSKVLRTHEQTAFRSSDSLSNQSHAGPRTQVSRF